ncbi:pectin lyase-like protein [Rickenella mellea]|uniref:galacturonan 1,4-alpha-galacturonidase n=1 Tax=Rickenella mellea TaxID=50990 RepID=A0A4Y7QKA1_9AGAM|nr:pectin lyase-like protein [Rickenella mellea]
MFKFGGSILSIVLLFVGASTTVQASSTPDWFPFPPAHAPAPPPFDPFKICTLFPLGHGRDDTDQVLKAIQKCGQSGRTIFLPGEYNITRKMTWNLENSVVDLFGFLNFEPNIDFWMQANNTYRVVFIQSQASWFVLTGKNFVVDAHKLGGIHGNGQPWWEHFQTVPRADGDGRPLALTLFNVTGGTVRNFHIESPPFWCNAVSQSTNVIYDGMKCNATNTNATFAGKNIVPNTDGIDTYRSTNVQLLNWDVTCGDDCLAIKGNSSNILAKNIVCRGGNGIAFGSLGQYVQFNDIVENVVMDNLLLTRLDPSVQPNMVSGVYFKSWTGTSNGLPPTAGGGGGGFVKNVTLRNVVLDRVDRPTRLYQTNNAKTGDQPSKLQFSDITWINWSGTSTTNRIVDLECSTAAPCPNMEFQNFNVPAPSGLAPMFICQNVVNESGLPGAYFFFSFLIPFWSPQPPLRPILYLSI